jgi:hypothetical protein
MVPVTYHMSVFARNVPTATKLHALKMLNAYKAPGMLSKRQRAWRLRDLVGIGLADAGSFCCILLCRQYLY